MTVFEELAAVACGVRTSDLPKAVASAARDSFVDTIGVMFAGRGEPAARIVAGTIQPTAGARAWVVTGGCRAPADAAFVNATAAHALDFDDATTVALSGHASAVLVPVTLALGQSSDKPFDELLSGYVAGFEIELTLARLVGPALFDRGFHPTAVLGVFGSAAAAASLLDATVSQTAGAFAIAASFASGIKANFGTMTKPVHCGWAARSGILAVELSVAGLTSNAGAFEDTLGFSAAFAGKGVGQIDPLGGPRSWALTDPGVDLRKIWPVCGSVITAIEASLELRPEVVGALAMIDRIDIGLHARRIAQVDRSRPISGQDARYSAQYVVARTLLDGAPTPLDFVDSAVVDPRVRWLMDRTAIGPDPRQTERTERLDGQDLGAHIAITLVDGRSFESIVDYPIGGRTKPMSPTDLVKKFKDNTEPVLGRDVAHRLLGALQGAGSSRFSSRVLPGLRNTDEGDGSNDRA